MKSRKLKLLKTIGLLTGAITIISTPIIATSCSSQDNTTNDTNKPGNGGNTDQGGQGGDTGQGGGGTGGTGDSTSKKVPQLQKDITLDVPYTSIFKDGYINVDESLDAYFGKSDNLKNYITNKDSFTSDELQSITATVDTDLNSKIREKNLWGNELYNSWSTGKTSYIYEPQKSLEVNVDIGLKGILEDRTKLTKIAEESGIQLSTGKTISLDETKRPEVVNNSLNVAVKISGESSRSAANTEETISILEIPFSSTILNLSNLDLTLKSENDKVASETNATSNIDLDVTINSTPANKKEFEKGFVMPTDKTVTTDGFAKAFGFAFEKDEFVVNNHSINSVSEKKQDLKTLTYDNKKMEDFFEIYNVNFGNFNINPIDGSTGSPGDDSYKGLFNISVDATPKSGFKWDDGSTNKKTLIQKNVSINVKVSSIDFSKGKDNNYKEKLTITNKTQQGVNEYFANEKNKNDFLSKYEGILKTNKSITNCKLVLDDAQWDNKNVLVRLTIKPKDGCAFEDGNSEGSFTAVIGVK